MGNASAAPRTLAWQWALALALAVWAALVAIIFHTAPRLYSLPLLALTTAPLVIFAGRNPRLFFLIGAVFTSGLGLSINFMLREHIGGAPGFSIEAVDFFLLPLVVFLVRDLLAGYRHGLRIPSLTWWWVGLFLVGVLSLALGPNRQLQAFELVRMLKVWLLFLVIVNECVRERHFHHVLMAIVGLMVFNLAIGLAQYALKRSLGLQALGEPDDGALAGANQGVYLGRESVFRISGVLGHPNLYGAYLAMTMPMVIAALFTDYSVRMRVLLSVVAAVGTVNLVLTLSRSAWLSFAFGFLILLVVVMTGPQFRRRYARLKTGLIICSVMAAMAAAGPVIKRFTQSDSGATDFRLEWAQVSWSMMLDDPFLGHGLNTYWLAAIPYAPYPTAKMQELFGPVWPVVHNTYLLVWTEQGTVGILLFLGLHIHLLLLAARNLRLSTSPLISAMSLGAMCGVLAILVDNLSSIYIRVTGPARTFWIMAAIIVAADYWNRANRGKHAGIDPSRSA